MKVMQISEWVGFIVMGFWRSSDRFHMEATVCRHPWEWGVGGWGSRRGKLRSEQVGRAPGRSAPSTGQGGGGSQEGGLLGMNGVLRGLWRGALWGEGVDGAVLPRQGRGGSGGS